MVLNQWSAKWHSTTDLVVGGSKSTTQRKKEEAKLKMTDLDAKRKKEVADKAHVEREVTQQTGKQTGGTEQGYDKGARSHSPDTEEEHNNTVQTLRRHSPTSST